MYLSYTLRMEWPLRRAFSARSERSAKLPQVKQTNQIQIKIGPQGICLGLHQRTHRQIITSPCSSTASMIELTLASTLYIFDQILSIKPVYLAAVLIHKTLLYELVFVIIILLSQRVQEQTGHFPHRKDYASDNDTITSQ